MEKKLQKTCPTDYSLLIVQDIWQVHYQILPILFLKEFVKLNVNTDMMKKNVRLAELNANIVTALLNTNFKDDLIKYKCLCCKRNYHQKFDENFTKWLFYTYKFSTHDINKFIYIVSK